MLRVLVVLSFFLGLELGQVFQLLHPEAFLIRTKLDILRKLDSVNDLLSRSDSQFLDFVAFEEEINLNEMLAG